MAKKCKSLLLVILLLVLVVFGIGASDVNYKMYEVRNYGVPNFELIITEYDNYLELCEKYQISVDYSEDYFENDGLVFAYKVFYSANGRIVINKIDIENSKYVVDMDEKFDTGYMSEGIIYRVFLFEESKKELSSIKEVIIN